MLPRPFHALLGLASLALATASVISPRVVHERRAVTPRGWSLQRRADPGDVLPLSFALVQPNVGNLEAYLLDIADPTSPNYGKHWSPSKVAETFRPSAETTDVVRAWLEGEGIWASRVQLSKDGGYLNVDVTVAEAEAMLGTEYYVYKHVDGTRHVACGERYHLPEHVAKHVDTVWPSMHFDVVPLSRRSARSVVGQAPTNGKPSTKHSANLVRLRCLLVGV